MRKTLALAFMFMGCGTDQSAAPTLLAGFDPGPAPESGFQAITPIVRNIPPGANIEYCTWTDTIINGEVDIKSVQGIQSTTGHHALLYTTTVHQPPGTTRECTDTDMATFRFAAGGAGEGTSEKYTLPTNLVFRTPADSQMVINHHWVNETDNPVDGQAAINVWTQPAAANDQQVGSMVVLDTSMSIPATGGGMDVTCTMNKNYPAWTWLPHMHDLGKHITVDHISGGQSTRLVDQDWQPNLTFHPPTTTVDPSTPRMFAAGDQVKIHCDWSANPAGTAITFGREMCVFFAGTVDSLDDPQPSLDCDQQAWGPF